MGQKMTWQEICEHYPNEWVVVVDYKNTGPVEVDGVVAAHEAKRSSLTKEASQLIKEYGEIAVRYTGELIQESDLPLLWQISLTA